MLDPIRAHPAGGLHRRVDHRRRGDGDQLSAGADAARVGRITVTVEMPESGGLYRFANVTYRGVQIGKVTDIDVARDSVIAQLSLDASPTVPADVVAEIRSVSAVGEQYVDLQPRTKAPPYLGNGSVIPEANVVLPQQVGPDDGPIECAGHQHPQRQAEFAARRDLRGPQRRRPRSADADRFVLERSHASSTPPPTGASALIEDAAPVLDSQAAERRRPARLDP